MGNTETKNLSDQQIQVAHEKFKRVEVMQNMEQMILTIPYQHKNDILEWQKLLKDVRQVDPQFLLMPKRYMIAQENFCGSSGVLKIVYDCFTYSFEKQIINHSQKFKYFEEAEIWYLLFAIISSVREMNRLSRKVGDIRPHNIFVNENGQVKLAGVYSWPRQLQNTSKTSFDKVITYLAPQEVRQCRMGEKDKQSHIVGQSFSVGLTLLHTCLLKDMSDLYNLKKFDFNIDKLQYEINELKKLTYWNQQKGSNQKYSKQLISIITGLLEIDQKKRINTLFLFNQLEPHAEQILNLRQFQLPEFKVDTPIKQQQQVQSVLMSSLQHHHSSPQYSSIPKKDFNEPESMAFETNYPIGLISTKQANTLQHSFNKVSVPERKTPQKRTRSKEKMQVSLINQRQSLFAKTQKIPQIPRQSVTRQKFNSNPQVTFTIPKTETQNKQVKTQIPSTYQYTAEFKTYDTQFKPDKPLIGVALAQQHQKKLQGPTFNYTTSKYVSYSQAPLQQVQYRPIDPSYRLGYVQAQTPQFTYKPPITFEPQPIQNISTDRNYPFTKNVEFTKSDFTIFEQNSNLNSQRVSLTGANQPQNVQNTTDMYHVSTVKPVLPGQTSFNIGIGEKIGSEPSQLLKRIDQQISKSKQMFTGGSAF